MTIHKPKKIEKVDPKYIGIPNINFSLTEKNDELEKLYRKQRIKRGFDDSETWDLTGTVVKFTLPRLKRYKEISIALLNGTISEEESNKILNKMILAMELIIKADKETIMKEDWDKVKEGMDLFYKYFNCLGW